MLQQDTSDPKKEMNKILHPMEVSVPNINIKQKCEENVINVINNNNNNNNNIGVR
jgi:hypothetical protein